MSNKELFKKFTEENKQHLPFSMKYSWWNEVVKDNWEVSIVANQTQVIAIWPYFCRKKGPWKLLTNPHFTPYCGPFLNYPEGQKTEKRISFEHKVHQQLIDSLPRFSELSQNFNFSCTNTLAFIWGNFSVQNRFTYLLDLHQSEEAIWTNFRESTRRQIRKAEKSLVVELHESSTLIESTLKGSYYGQKTSYPEYDADLFRRITAYLKNYETGIHLKAIDREKKVHASLTLVWDESTAYYLIGGANAENKNSGALSLLMWEAIKISKKQGKRVFNFEGSIIPAIEKYLRGFGGELSPYFNVSKSNSAALHLAKRLKG